MSQVSVWFDGACEPVNPGGHVSYGFVVESEGKTIKKNGYVGEGDEMTNNVAEYKALINAIKYVLDSFVDVSEIDIYGDSELVVKQITGEYDVSDETLQHLWSDAVNMLNSFNEYSITHIPREENEDADSLSKKAGEKHIYPDRYERAQQNDMETESLDKDGVYLVKGKYRVDVVDQTCTCPDNQQRGSKCKHLFRVEIEIDDGDLPEPIF